ncbi:hypothetical protein KEF29_29575 [Streptomyces tuirus]|uniref:Uncharacterized protein n=1 Tax=Streptomyces tuirus TaxID=68278 RepID=A0A941J4A5_9ACTN|nr:hypothetical protein [Streptomyces tuirus]
MGSILDVSGELATVGATAASALVVAMAGDGWRGFRGWLGSWFGRGGESAAARQLDRLDRDRAALVAVPEDERADRAGDLSAAWAVRLQDAADEDHEAAQELLDYVKQWRSDHPEAAPQVTVVRQRAEAKGKSHVTQVGRDQTVINPGRS